jgi:hypothetical protein
MTGPWLTIDRDLQIRFRDGRAVHLSNSGFPLEGTIDAVRNWILRNESDPRMDFALRWLECARDQLEARRPSTTECEWREACRVDNQRWRKYLRTDKCASTQVKNIERGVAEFYRERMGRAGMSAEKIEQIICEDLLPFGNP